MDGQIPSEAYMVEVMRAWREAAAERAEKIALAHARAQTPEPAEPSRNALVREHLRRVAERACLRADPRTSALRESIARVVDGAANQLLVNEAIDGR
jgi:plasmid stabilization system protein ParE